MVSPLKIRRGEGETRQCGVFSPHRPLAPSPLQVFVTVLVQTWQVSKTCQVFLVVLWLDDEEADGLAWERDIAVGREGEVHSCLWPMFRV